MLGSGKILRIPFLDFFEGTYPLTQVLVDRRIIAPVDNVSQTVGWKIIDGDVVHRCSFSATAPAREDRSPLMAAPAVHPPKEPRCQGLCGPPAQDTVPVAPRVLPHCPKTR